MPVYRCYVERKPGFDLEAKELQKDLRASLRLAGLSSVRILNRYDVEGVSLEVFRAAIPTIFTNPVCDEATEGPLPAERGDPFVFSVEALPGQFDQRADSAAMCMELASAGARPLVASAKTYLLYGVLSDAERAAVTRYLINPVECRLAAEDIPDTLKTAFPVPPPVETLSGFRALSREALSALRSDRELAMDLDDLLFFQSYFNDEGRDPTITELKVVDTYWSDHCRHTTFLTALDRVDIADPDVADAYRLYRNVRREVYGDKADTRPETLMDLATIGAKYLKKRGLLDALDESEEINACSVKVTVDVDGTPEPWLLMFKNETHNHPTEIEPFGGAATCLGGAIRDPLSGRSYVYQAMRITGAGDPRTTLSETPEGKLPQKKLTRTAAAGYSSYGNQIGLSTGLVREIYHPGYVAKRMELGAVLGAAPAENVRRERPEPGDVVILLGGRTGRDGIGGATGSSKSHSLTSVAECASEVQKGNAPEERKIQRLFRKPDVARLIRRCNDFGAGGVAVAIGELAPGLVISLDNVPKKYEGLDGTELAISESQERMAVVVSADDADTFIREANVENLEATVIAEVAAEPRLKMRWRGDEIVDLSREFLNSNGAEKHASAEVPAYAHAVSEETANPFSARMEALVTDLNVASQFGLQQRFDSNIGRAGVLMPHGGRHQTSAAPVMASLFPVEAGKTTTASVMSFAFDPFLSSDNPFEGARTAVIESLAKLVAAGADFRAAHLTFQEYFERLGNDKTRWGKPFSALLGALTAQLGLGVASIGGKDSMSGSFPGIDVPPTLVSFAVGTANARDILTAEFRAPGHPVYLLAPESSSDWSDMKALWIRFLNLARSGKILSARAVSSHGAADALFQMARGNRVGMEFDREVSPDALFARLPGAIVFEAADELSAFTRLGRTAEPFVFAAGGETVDLARLEALTDAVLEDIFPTSTGAGGPVPRVTAPVKRPAPSRFRIAAPRALIPVFPGTNSEYDTAAALREAGADPEMLVIRNRTGADLKDSIAALQTAISRSQMIVIPGGFSGGDEPDGSAKFIAAFFRNPEIMDAVDEFLTRRDGLMLGICNGFQALVKLGLLPYGRITPPEEDAPTLTHNEIGRHQTCYVHTRVSSVNSPWLMLAEPGDIHLIPLSHGEGRFVASDDEIDRLVKNGQIATQYVDLDGHPSMDVRYNPNGSILAIEGISSPDGRILGKMGHTERHTPLTAKNLPHTKYQPLFAGGVAYFNG